MDRKRMLRFLLLTGALLVALTFGRSWPKEQMVHYVLGDSAARVAEVDARWGPRGTTDDWSREATFRYAPGRAPRVVTHEPRLPDGDYTVEVEIASASAVNVVRRDVTLSGGSTSIELAGSVPR